VFEEHLPETVRLPKVPVREGETVAPPANLAAKGVSNDCESFLVTSAAKAGVAYWLCAARLKPCPDWCHVSRGDSVQYGGNGVIDNVVL
jgi:hypothetical protein